MNVNPKLVTHFPFILTESYPLLYTLRHLSSFHALHAYCWPLLRVDLHFMQGDQHRGCESSHYSSRGAIHLAACFCARRVPVNALACGLSGANLKTLIKVSIVLFVKRSSFVEAAIAPCFVLLSPFGKDCIMDAGTIR